MVARIHTQVFDRIAYKITRLMTGRVICADVLESDFVAGWSCLCSQASIIILACPNNGQMQTFSLNPVFNVLPIVNNNSQLHLLIAKSPATLLTTMGMIADEYLATAP